MDVSRFWLIWPDNPALSLLVVALLAMAFLYAARLPMHQLIRATGHAVGGPLRIASRWLLAAATEINDRNKAVLLAQGSRELEKRVEREFERIATLVNRDLQGYPVLQRKLADEVTTIEEDYKKCGEVPPPPPDWVEAVDAVGKIKSGSGELATSILEGINQSINRIHDKALAEYRKSYEARHAILEKFMPCWRAIEKTLGQVDKNINGLLNSASSVDNLMAQYEQIVAKTDKAVHALTVSAMTQFGIALMVMVVAIGGTFINFKLIALPMSEMVGAADYITASLRTSEVAALVIILVEASMGLFLMETLRITRLFPVIGNLSDLRAAPHDVGGVDLAGHAGRHRGRAGADARHADPGQAGTGAIAGQRAAGSAERQLGRQDSHRGADAARLHPAVRADVRGDPAGVVDPFGAHGVRRAADGAGARLRDAAAHRRQPDPPGQSRAGAPVRRGHRVAAVGRARGRGRTRRAGAPRCGPDLAAAQGGNMSAPQSRPRRLVLRAVAAGLAAGLASACSDPRSHSQAVYMLVDTSGTYVLEADKAQAIVNFLLGTLNPGDSLAVARVQSRSFSEKDIVAKATFDTRPSQANAQKRAFRDKTDGYFKGLKGSAFTDITGGLLQGAEYLNETGAGTRTLVIFSDMQEELDKVTVRNFPIDLKNIRVIAVNVVKLNTDNIDPRRYLGRIEAWEKRVLAAGAKEWRVINDLERLNAIFERA